MKKARSTKKKPSKSKKAPVRSRKIKFEFDGDEKPKAPEPPKRSKRSAGLQSALVLHVPASELPKPFKLPVRQCPAPIPQHPALTTYYGQPVKVYLPSEITPTKILAYTVVDYYDVSEGPFTVEQLEFLEVIFQAVKSGDGKKIRAAFNTLRLDPNLGEMMPKIVQFITDEVEAQIQDFRNPLLLKNIILMIEPILKNETVNFKIFARSFLSILYEVNQQSVMRVGATPTQEDLHTTAFKIFAKIHSIYGNGLPKHMEEIDEFISF